MARLVLDEGTEAAVMFLPVPIALLRRRFVAALVVAVMIIVATFALVVPVLGWFFGATVWLIALCVGAFAGSRKVIVMQRT